VKARFNLLNTKRTSTSLVQKIETTECSR